MENPAKPFRDLRAVHFFGVTDDAFQLAARNDKIPTLDVKGLNSAIGSAREAVGIAQPAGGCGDIRIISDIYFHCMQYAAVVAGELKGPFVCDTILDYFRMDDRDPQNYGQKALKGLVEGIVTNTAVFVTESRRCGRLAENFMQCVRHHFQAHGYPFEPKGMNPEDFSLLQSGGAIQRASFHFGEDGSITVSCVF